MLIGIVVGTYSSIFIAAPILLFLEQRYGARGKPGAPGRTPAKVRGARV
jgi:preprotein translocase subunit SecF